MRLRQLDLLRYGKFTDRSVLLPRLPRGTPDFHLIVGANEAGKSTLRQAIVDALFGIPVRTPLGFLHPMSELRLGLMLEGESKGEGEADASLVFQRTKGNKNTLRRADDTPWPDASLVPWLGSLERTAFERMHALDHDALKKGGEAILDASDDLGRLLFQSAASIEHLGSAHQALRDEADLIWAPRRATNRLWYQAQDAYEKAQAELRAATVRPRDWKARHDALGAAAAALDAAKVAGAALQASQRKLERVRRVRPLLQALDQHAAALAALQVLGPTPRLADDAAATLDAATRKLALVEAERTRLHTLAATAATSLTALVVDDVVLARTAEITTLNEQRLRCSAHAADLVTQGARVAAAWAQTQDHARALDWPADDEAALRQRLPSRPRRQSLAALIGDGKALQAELLNARNNVEKNAQAHAALQTELAGLNDSTAPAALRSLVDEAVQLGPPEATRASLLSEGALHRRQLDDALAALLGLTGSERDRAPLGALHRQLVPELAQVEDSLRQQRDDQARRDAAEESVGQAQRELARLELELKQLLRDQQPVGTAEVNAARATRDERWQALRTRPADLPALADVYEDLVRVADSLADARHERTAAEAARRAHLDRIEQQGLVLAGAEQALVAISARMAERRTAWASLCTACGLPAMPLELGASWLQQRLRVLELTATTEAADQRLADFDASVKRLRDGLAALLDGAVPGAASLPGHEDRANPADQSDHVDHPAQAGQGPQDKPASAASLGSLATLIVIARERLAAADEARGRRLTLLNQQRAAANQMALLNAALTRADGALAAWQTDWDEAVAAASLLPGSTPAQVEARLATLDALAENLDEMRKIRSERIATMQDDLDQLARAAQALADDVAPELAQTLGLAHADAADDADADLPAGSAARVSALVSTLVSALVTRRDAAAAAAARRADLQAQEDAARRGLADCAREEAEALALLEPLRAASGVTDLAGLRAAIGRADERRRIEADNARQRGLLDQGRDGQDDDTLRAEIATCDPDTLQAELDDCAARAHANVEEVAALSARHADARRAAAADDGAANAAVAEARRQEAIAALAEATERYLRVHVASELLRWAMEQFRRTRQGPLLTRAGALFNMLTRGSFTRLVVDTDEKQPRLAGLRPDGKQVEVSGMSEGSRDQLFLALRLAALEAQATAGTVLPLIADDLFINFDDGRTAAGLRVLGELARHTQVIFLTHHSHLADIARSVLGAQLNVVTLDAS